jgi:CheY-like chemotaxis protein/HPt (histidine-containing phosphotransfer) domain-containing protein
LQEVEKADIGITLVKPVSASLLFDTILHVLGEPVSEPETSKAVAQGIPDLSGSGARILLVEDNEINQQIAGEILQQAGFLVGTVGNGSEAVEAVQRTTYDAILMDVQMPIMDGYEATRRIRASEFPNTRIPIIAMTANAMAEDEKKSLAAGMDAHITKPINPAILLQTLATWVKPPSGTGSTPPEKKIDDADLPLTNGLPGIDTKAGLRTVQGNSKLYLKLLLKFRNTQIHFEETFRAAQNDADPRAAARAAHTLAGVAGNLGAREVNNAAKALEQGCIKHLAAEEIESLLRNAVVGLETVLKGLSEYQDIENRAAMSANQVNETDARSIFEYLRKLLEQDDTDAVDVANQLRGAQSMQRHADILERLLEAVNLYKFDQALQHWHELDSIFRKA